MKTKILIILIVLISLGVGGFFVWKNIVGLEVKEKVPGVEEKIEEEIVEEAGAMGIPTYPGATEWLIPSEVKSGLGVPAEATCEGYTTSANPEDVMDWYKNQMGDWTLMSEDSFSPPDQPEMTIYTQHYKKGENGAFIFAMSDPHIGGATVLGIATGPWSVIQGCSRPGPKGEVETIEPATLTQVTYLGTTIDPDWSPDGSQIAFGFVVNTSKMGIINADGTGLRYIVPGGSPAWSPVENKIAYIWQGTRENVTFVVEPHEKIYGVVTVNTDGENITYLANGCFPAWSPDGTKIVYAVSEDNYDVPPGGSSSIWVMNSDGSGKTQLTTEEDGICMQPSFSYDGSKIVYLKGATDGQYMKTYGLNEIWVMDNDGLNKHQIYAPGDSWSWISKRSWNKDNKILFVRIPISPSPGGGIWVINSDGSNPHGPVVQTPSYAYGDPVWSNDGTKVALTRFPSPAAGGDFTPDIFIFSWEE